MANTSTKTKILEQFQQTDYRRAIRILQVELPDPLGNARYVDQIIRHAPPDTQHIAFRWRRALFGQYDVIHFHWPEYLLRHPKRIGRFRCRIRFIALLVSLRLRGIAIVRTLHNAAPHEGGDRVEAWLLRALERQTDLFIRLNPFTSVPAGKRSVMIPHGDYHEALDQFPRYPRVRGRVLFLGKLRRYKGIEQLLSAFAALEDRDVSLRIVGQPHDATIVKQIDAAVASDNRISRVFGFVADEYMAKEMSEAELVILPYQNMHNSGVLFAALSVGTPVVVPDTGVNRWIAEEIGQGWIYTYGGQLAADDLEVILGTLENRNWSTMPRMNKRNWELIANQYAAVYTSLRRQHTKLILHWSTRHDS